jgi:hypothetical protein
MNSIMAPFLTPTKRLICREELSGVHDSRSLGAGMDSSAFHGGSKYCHNGAWASPPAAARGDASSSAEGSVIGTDGPPLRHPQNILLCRENDWWTRGSMPLGAQMSSSACDATPAPGITRARWQTPTKPCSKSRSLRTRQRPGEGQSPPRRPLWLPLRRC